MRPTILIAGLGDLGAVVLELLAREPWPGRILAGSRHESRTTARVNLARLGAQAQGCRPDLEAVRLDLDDVEDTADRLRAIAPEIILCTATRQSWWLPERLPEGPRAALGRAGFGVWLPVHLVLSVKLMRALACADHRAHVAIAPFPDVANCVLARIGLAPTCGVGNLDEIVPKLESLAAARLGLPPGELEITLVAHHALESFAFANDRPAGPVPPHFLRIRHGDRDVTVAAGAEALLLSPYPISAGPASHFLTAGSAVRLLRALASETEHRRHAPGPEGLPGGYPVVASAAGVRVAAIRGLSRSAAIEINERSHPFDGIDRIESDGTVVYRPESSDVLRRELGYDCDRLPPAEIDARADELVERFQAYAARHGSR